MKPPPIDDGTPNESVSDVFVRVTQLMSILETQYSKDTVIIVSPDSDNLSVLQAGLLGIDLRRYVKNHYIYSSMHESSWELEEQACSLIQMKHLINFAYWLLLRSMASMQTQRARFCSWRSTLCRC